MTISVIIPAFNEEKYLPQTLLSLKSLDRKPDEVIVIDGGSTDGTSSVAKKFDAKAIVVEHRGIGFARQKGLEAAKTDIVAFTDADSVVPRDWLTIIERVLSQPKVVGVYGTFRVPDGWWPYRWYINFIQPPLNYLWSRVGVHMAAGQNFAFNRIAGLECGGFPLDYKIAEDIEMARRLTTQGELVYRPNLCVISSGRRGNEGIGLLIRIPKAFLYYFLFRKANQIGFPDMR